MQTGGGGLDVRSVDYLVPLRTIQNKTKTKVKRKTTKQVGGRKRKASTKTKVSKAKPRKTSVRKKSKSTKTKK